MRASTADTAIFDFDGVLLPGDAVAYSGSLSDLPILGAAEQPVLVNANARQVARARRLLGARLTTVTWLGGQGPEVRR